MQIDYPRFGRVVVGGETYSHDVIIEGGRVRPRDKEPSRALKRDHGHTPLSAGEDIPWSKDRVIIGSGYSGSLPVLPDVTEEARRRGVELVIVPTAEACRMLSDVDDAQVCAVLHVTC